MQTINESLLWLHYLVYFFFHLSQMNYSVCVSLFYLTFNVLWLINTRDIFSVEESALLVQNKKEKRKDKWKWLWAVLAFFFLLSLSFRLNNLEKRIKNCFSRKFCGLSSLCSRFVKWGVMMRRRRLIFRVLLQESACSLTTQSQDLGSSFKMSRFSGVPLSAVHNHSTAVMHNHFMHDIISNTSLSDK